MVAISYLLPNLLPLDIQTNAKSSLGSHMGIQRDAIDLKFERHLDNIITKDPAKFQSEESMWTQACGFETLRDLTLRHPTDQWIEGLGIHMRGNGVIV